MKYWYIGLAVLVLAIAAVLFASPYIQTYTAELELNKQFAPVVKNKDEITLIAFGDMMFDRGVREAIEKKGVDPLKNVPDIIKAFDTKPDIVMANLEGPITEVARSTCQKKPYSFKFASTTAQKIKDTGFTYVALANNHSYDCLRQGLLDTRMYLDQSGVDHSGGGTLDQSYVIRTVKDKKIAFVSVDETIQDIPLDSFYPLVKELDPQVDYVIVNIHWGIEYQRVQSQKQTLIAQKFIDNGADLIVGHHPHVVQPIGVYKGKVILYSLGNFIFDQPMKYSDEGIAVGLRLGSTTEVVVLPFAIGYREPKLKSKEEIESFCQEYLQNFQEVRGCVLSVSGN